MSKIEALKAFANNPNSVVFGKQNNNLMAQVEAFKAVCGESSGQFRKKK